MSTFGVDEEIEGRVPSFQTHFGADNQVNSTEGGPILYLEHGIR